MDIPVLNPNSATVRLQYQHLPLQRNALTALYAAVVKDYDDYTTFNLLPQGGAKISRSDGSHILVENERMVIHDVVHDLGATVALEPFPLARERIAGLFKLVFAHATPQKFATAVKLIAHVETAAPDGALRVIGSALGPNFAAEKIEYHLGQKLTGVGVRIATTKGPPAPGFYDLRVEPLFRDLSRIYVDLDVQLDGSTDKLAELELQVAGVGAYLKGNVKDLLAAL